MFRFMPDLLFQADTPDLTLLGSAMPFSIATVGAVAGVGLIVNSPCTIAVAECTSGVSLSPFVLRATRVFIDCEQCVAGSNLS
jgi:hypothetical protein